MVIITDIPSLRQYIVDAKSANKSIGFVATMGALHDGHMSLIASSSVQNDLTVCSIFVNPSQFNNKKDLMNYPRETNKDISLLESSKCDMLFVPTVDDMYHDHFLLNFDFGYLEEIMEGKFRPGHFKGVGLIVTKFFNLIQPNKAYFGRKDLQQLVLIKTLAKELFFDIEIVSIDTIREKSGLALSSRNQLLNKKEKIEAVKIYQALLSAKEKLINGENVLVVREFISSFFETQTEIALEYFEIVNSTNLQRLDLVDDASNVSLCLAGHLGKVRLIDNISLI